MGARWPWLTETPVPLERSVKALSGRECCTRSLRNSFCGGLSYSVLPGRALPTTRCGGRQETTFKFLNRPSGSQPASRFLCNISAFGALPQRGKAVYCTRAQLPAQAAKPSLATQLLVQTEQEIQNKGKYAKSPPNSSTTRRLLLRRFLGVLCHTQESPYLGGSVAGCCRWQRKWVHRDGVWQSFPSSPTAWIEGILRSPHDMHFRPL